MIRSDLSVSTFDQSSMLKVILQSKRLNLEATKLISTDFQIHPSRVSTEDPPFQLLQKKLPLIKWFANHDVNAIEMGDVWNHAKKIFLPIKECHIWSPHAFWPPDHGSDFLYLNKSAKNLKTWSLVPHIDQHNKQQTSMPGGIDILWSF